MLSDSKLKCEQILNPVNYHFHTKHYQINQINQI